MRLPWIATIVALAACDRAFGLERNEQPAGDWAVVAAGLRTLELVP